MPGMGNTILAMLSWFPGQMPDYHPPFFLFNTHLETIYPALFRKVSLPAYKRERINTPDEDFLDLDWIQKGHRDLLIISHGLEGNTQRAYVKGMARAALAQDFDVLAWNFRGCSEEINRQLYFYHSGATHDLDCVVKHAINYKDYRNIYLLGFSLGGNLTLKFLGENRNLDPKIKKAVAISVPMDLYGSCLEISKIKNRLYEKRFLNSLKEKIILKEKLFPGKLDLSLLSKIKNLISFDNYFTAPLHGYKNAQDYYQQCSSLQFLKDIKIPVLVLNAKNDPFLSLSCYPEEPYQGNPLVHLNYPNQEGHVGFSHFNHNGIFWSEKKAIEFFKGSIL